MPETTTPSPCSAARATFRSLQLTERQARKSLGGQRTEKLMALMEEFVIRLPRFDFIGANMKDIKLVGRAMLASGRSKEQMQLLQMGLVAFFDAAVQLKLAKNHPIRDRKPANVAPMTSTLLVGLDPAIAEQARKSLALPGSEIECEASPMTAATMVSWYPFQRIISGFPLADPGVELILDRVRFIDSPTRRAAVVLLTSEERIEKASTFLGHGCNSVVDESNVTALNTEFTRIGNVAPRVPLKIPMLVSDADVAGSAKTMWQTHNISTSGILARTSAKVDVGKGFDCEMCLPGNTRAVRFQIEVTRATSGKRENLTGIAARFTGFETGAQQILNSFVSGQLRKTP